MSSTLETVLSERMVDYAAVALREVVEKVHRAMVSDPVSAGRGLMEALQAELAVAYMAGAQSALALTGQPVAALYGGWQAPTVEWLERWRDK